MDEEIAQLKSAGLFRELKTSRRSGKYIEVNGVSYLDFGSNDYLGISAREDFQEEFLEQLCREKNFLFGSCGSRLLTGNHEDYELAEAEIGVAYGRECLVINSGYHANTGLIPSIAGKGDLILCDKLAHASIIDALKLSEAKWMRFAHNDIGHLRRLLEEQRAEFNRVLIVTESVFSMDGDRADLKALARLKKEFDALLYVDEAHSFGVFGEDGLGLSQELEVVRDIDFIVCTLGKAMAGEGAFVLSSALWREVFVNRMRPLIFTTALPPVNLRWMRFVMAKIMKMHAERKHLKMLTHRFRDKLAGASLLGETQIVPLVAGEAKSALGMSSHLAGAGIWAPAVRWPTVPANSARIRFSLSAAMDVEDVDRCAKTIMNNK